MSFGLWLFVDSKSPGVDMVVQRLTDLSRHHLGVCGELTVLDLDRDTDAFERHRVVGTPTLDIHEADKKIRFVGDMTSAEILITAMGMRVRAANMYRRARSMRERADSEEE